jgi:hypothetical protein
LLSGAAGVVVLFVSAPFTFGASLAAPFGIFAVRRVFLGRRRPVTRLASWFGASAAAAVAFFLAMLVLIAWLTPGALGDMREAVATAQARDIRLPDWMSRVSPQAARSDSLRQDVVNSPAFAAASLALGIAMGCGFFGAFAGSAGWLGTLLLSYAVRGRWLPPDTESHGPPPPR